jgi:hypothetical protein
MAEHRKMRMLTLAGGWEILRIPDLEEAAVTAGSGQGRKGAARRKQGLQRGSAWGGGAKCGG